MPSFFTAYVTAALSSLPPGRRLPSAAYIEPETMAKMREDCKRFFDDNRTDLTFLDTARAGEGFWLARNGAIEFEHSIPGTRSQRLTDAAKGFGPFPLTVGDDGVIRNE